MKTKVLTYGELFCGPGGIAKGAKNIQLISKGKKYVIRPIWAIDNDKSSCLTFRKNIFPYKSDIITAMDLPSMNGDGTRYVINDDITKIDFTKLPKVDVLAFGFPCNDFSMIGKMEGIKGKYGALYKYGVKALEVLQPEFFIAENVSGLASKNQKNVLKNIIEEIKSAGPTYKVYNDFFRLEDYGIPQTRHRIFIVGFKNHNIEFVKPKPTYETITAYEAIVEGKVYGEGPLKKDTKNHDIKKPHPRVQARLYQTKPGQNAWTADLDDDLKLKGVKGAKFSSIYRKLDPKKPAYTVTGSGGGGTSMYHWTMAKNKQRALTNRERARLQTFSDNFIFYGNHTEVRRQVGMAVPVKAAEMIFKACLKTFSGI
jgi:DNA (cytosine-5)-methyltransferase 1|tara:strand:+ start:5215 stop:6324 length:1110 start_codon:yes stop_codon:yes gene_type:complete